MRHAPELIMTLDPELEALEGSAPSLMDAIEAASHTGLAAPYTPLPVPAIPVAWEEDDDEDDEDFVDDDDDLEADDDEDIFDDEEEDDLDEDEEDLFDDDEGAEKEQP